ncbi:collagen alpha-2(I) chain-like [Eubalaena glacialis]|uniref:collagen alpha-2(I) chain-like n=1 Tax=Eubalaena glacialis TaxID=27606 RepID=UPI002A598B9A|nr:collagen alpha-2(I) chain-like [Eubalaena glacialis]
MAAALSLGSGEGTRPGAGWRREGRGGERRRGARAAPRGARGAWGGGGARGPPNPPAGPGARARGAAPGVALERGWERPRGLHPPCRQPQPRASTPHPHARSQAPEPSESYPGARASPFSPSQPHPKECRPRWRVQPRAAERQHPAPLRASHVASQNLGALFCQVAVTRGSLRGRERYSRRRGNYAQGAKKKKPCAGSHNLEPACPSTSDPPAVRGPGRHSSSRLASLTGLFIPKSRVETDEMKARAGRLFARRPSPSLMGGLLLLTQHVLLGQCLWNPSWRQGEEGGWRLS